MKGPLLKSGMTVYIPVDILDVDEASEEYTYWINLCDQSTKWVGHENLMDAMKEADKLYSPSCGPNQATRKQLIENEIERLYRELEEIS